jgi:hypothetical protein
VGRRESGEVYLYACANGSHGRRCLVTDGELGRGQYRLTLRRSPASATGPGVAAGLIIIGSFAVEVGEGLQVTILETGDVRFCMLGTVVDYSRPDISLREALAELAPALVAEGPACVAGATRFLGGHWLLLWNANGRTYAFLDPTGMLRLFYMGSGSSLIGGSDPHLVSDGDAFRAAAAAYVAGMGGEHWWPGPVSPMPGLRQLLPNHHLCLDDGVTARCWPAEAFPQLSLAEATSRCSELLANGIAGLRALPQGLCMALTAGQDTRVLLAATRGLVDECEYFTFRYASMNDGHYDLVVAGELARRFGLKYSIIDTPAKMSESFAHSYAAHVMEPHAQWGPLAEAMLHSPLASRLLLKGNPGGEVFREPLGPFHDEWVDPVSLRDLVRLRDVQCVNHSLTEWCQTTVPWHQRDPAFHLAELFFWEQRMGCWQAMSQEEYGIAQESFCPFNCRAVYEIAFGVRRKFRRKLDSRFQRELVRAMWPELLEVPVNPGHYSRRTRAHELLKRTFPRAYIGYARRRWRRKAR